MPVPLHKSCCRTWMYKTECWDCGAVIYILQCTCGSVVLFNNDSPPFESHTCSGGIGDSGLSGWNAIDVLRNEGMPVTPEVMEIVFGKIPKPEENNALSYEIKAIKPTSGEALELIANVTEFHEVTAEVVKYNNLTILARELEGFSKDVGQVNQITLTHGVNENLASYTAFIPCKLSTHNFLELKKSRALCFVKLKGLRTWWLVENIEIL